MTAPPPSSVKIPVALGFRAIRGGGVVAGVALDDGEPRVVLSGFLATAAEGDRLAYEPYHVAAEMERSPDGGASAEAAAAVAEGRKRQNQLAAQSLADIIGRLRDAACEPAIAALLLNRASWIPDLLAYSLAWPDHPPVAEGLAVRDAIRFALDQCGVPVVQTDEKSLPEAASERLCMAPDEMNHRLKALGAAAGRPWRKEQKLACLSAWAALAALHKRPATSARPGSA